MNTYAIIVAGGSGSRMKSEIPKQFLKLNNKPLLYYALDLFYRFSTSINIILVLPEIHISTWKSMIVSFDIHIPHKIVAGGPTRFHSVKSGLKALSTTYPEDLVAIHDGVRPFVNQRVIKEGFTIASHKGSAIPVVPIHQTMRKVTGSFSKIVPREKYCLVQTPQFFRLDLITESYNILYSEMFTDDAGVFEASGRQITLFDGNKENIKITEPDDFRLAEMLLESWFHEE